jgi:L-alanine-DL-glutamate epimerase-like enolase superfamily enzyme
MDLEHRRIDLPLRHPWTISRGTSQVRTNVLVRLTHEGLNGLGEAAPNSRYGEDWSTVLAALDRIGPLLGEGPEDHGTVIDRMAAQVQGHASARAAIDIALHDLAARRRGEPLYRLLGADPAKIPETSYSIGLDAIPVMQEKAREAERFRILKVKLGTPADRDIVKAIRAVTDKPLYADANEAWTDPKQAIAMIRWMEGMGVVLVEQPLPAADLEGAKQVRDQVSMPVFADEAASSARDLEALAQAYDGVNVKVQKAGGLREARRMIEVARSLGLQVLLGCMVETSIGITASAHLAGLVDRADLDGNLLLRDDPFRGASVRAGRVVPAEGPGLGVEGTW